MNDAKKIQVITHDGYRAKERPMAVVLDGKQLAVVAIEDTWVAAGVDPKTQVTRGFVVRCKGGARFRLTHGDTTGWHCERLPGPCVV